MVPCVVSYWNSTSNHNMRQVWGLSPPLYLIEILHQTTTMLSIRPVYYCCILLKFYIKPQLVVLDHTAHECCILLKFYIKPQLKYAPNSIRTGCILLKFYIKPQPLSSVPMLQPRCILLKFYIKPQLLNKWKQNCLSCILLKFYIKPQRRASYWLIKCYLRAVCHYKNTIGCSDEASLMHFPYFKERK